jgi:hypothetical protein
MPPALTSVNLYEFFRFFEVPKSSFLFRQRRALRGVAGINPAVARSVRHCRVIKKFVQAGVDPEWRVDEAGAMIRISAGWRMS